MYCHNPTCPEYNRAVDVPLAAVGVTSYGQTAYAFVKQECQTCHGGDLSDHLDPDRNELHPVAFSHWIGNQPDDVTKWDDDAIMALRLFVQWWRERLP